MSYPNKIYLEENEMPTQWYNITADLPEPMPPALHPGTHQPATAEDFAPLFPLIFGTLRKTKTSRGSISCASTTNVEAKEFVLSCTTKRRKDCPSILAFVKLFARRGIYCRTLLLHLGIIIE